MKVKSAKMCPAMATVVAELSRKFICEPQVVPGFHGCPSFKVSAHVPG
jgi:hypothetical protein